jgi:histidinol-phosphate aminotransferase
MTMGAGLGSLEDEEYFKTCVQRVINCRQWTLEQLNALGMTTIPSDTNFLFTKSAAVSGKALYEGLRQRGILIRHFDTPRLRDYIRVTIGDEEQMKAFIEAMKEILEVAP